MAISGGCQQVQAPELAKAPTWQQAPAPQNPRPAAKESLEDTMYVAPGALNMRACPSLKCQVLRVLRQGAALETKLYKSGWYRVKTVDGKEGWVGARHLSQNRPSLVATPARKPARKPRAAEAGKAVAGEAAQPTAGNRQDASQAAAPASPAKPKAVETQTGPGTIIAPAD